LGGVERHEVDGDAGGEEFAQRGGVVADVPLGGGPGGFGVVVVAMGDGAAHDDDALEEAEGCGVAVDGGADVHEWADGDEGDFVGVGAGGVEDEGCGGLGSVGLGVGLGVGGLGEGADGWGGDAGSYGDVGVAGVGEEVGDDVGAGDGVAEGGGDAEDLELRGMEGVGDGEGVVYVVTDVGVDEDGDCGWLGVGGLLRVCGDGEGCEGEEDEREAAHGSLWQRMGVGSV